ncbi:AAA family ATPase [Breoghania sp. L-A4]|uniref:AAA family ATPase n=1 Tax=Breoghania sp. L-A4 TaxID=2304600 RepID=UPI0013C3530E|nr:AAA family ATPase [Breoghania sp. L-A4]
MRFKRLDLDRYGRFTGHSIDFGDVRKAGDFHLVYGPNEAGKSTLRDACIDFLFGFPHQTKYNFLHANPVLQIGAVISLGGVEHACRRIKRDSASLLGAGGEGVDETLFRAVLGDVSRAGYEQMFSLDEDSLVQGGDAILESEGDLGTLLFAAASGLSGLSGGLEAIRAEADGFFKKSGRVHRLKSARDELKALQETIRERDVQAGAFETLRGEEAARSAHYTEARELRDRNTARLDRLKTLLDALRPWRELQEREMALAEVADAPDAPDGWLAELETLAVTEAATRSGLRECGDAVTRATEVLEAIVVDEPALAIARAVKRLSEDDLEARYRTSQDIENRRRELRHIERDIADLCARLGRPDIEDPKSLVLPAATRGRIQELIEQRSGLLAREETAREEAGAARARRAAAAQALEEINETDEPADLADFTRRIGDLREDLDDRTRAARESRCHELEADLGAALAALAPWRGAPAELADLAVPDAGQLQQLQESGAALREDRAALAGDIERLLDEKAAHEAEIAALSRASDGIDDAAAREARGVRDRAWAGLRADLAADPVPERGRLETVADAVEAGIAECDRIQDRRLGLVSELTDLRRAGVALARCEAALGRAREKQAAAAQRFKAHEDAAGDLLKGLGLPPATPLASLDVWLERRLTALARIEGLERARGELAVVDGQRETAKVMLIGAMEAAGLAMNGRASETLDVRAALERCDAAIAAWTARRQARAEAQAALKEAAREAEARDKRHEAAEAARAAWEAAWQEVIASTWIGAASPAEVRELAGLLDTVSGKLVEADALRLRVEAMGEDRKAYTAEVTRLAEALGGRVEGDTPLDIADTLRRRVSQAEEAARLRRDRIGELEAAEARLAKARHAARAVAARIAEMTRIIPAQDLDGLRTALKRSEEKHRLQRDIARLETQLVAMLDAVDAATMRATLAECLPTEESIAALRAELGGLQGAREAEEAHVAALYHEWKTAETALKAIAGDGEVARLEEQRRVLLLDIEHEAHAYMRLSAGALLVEEALRSYRETHRSTMMRRASDAFVKMTRGGFTGLFSAQGKKGEVLVGMRSDGSTIVAPEMSRGTQFQLYLALRIAGHADFTEKREALPFFADDILEPFDDDRSAETFALLSEMSRRGQVVYLTHHRHLCDLARDVCGEDGVTLHELPGRGA